MAFQNRFTWRWKPVWASPIACYLPGGMPGPIKVSNNNSSNNNYRNNKNSNKISYIHNITKRKKIVAVTASLHEPKTKQYYIFDHNTAKVFTVCPRSLDPCYIVSYYIKWVKTSWTYSKYFCCIVIKYVLLFGFE